MKLPSLFPVFLGFASLVLLVGNSSCTSGSSSDAQQVFSSSVDTNKVKSIIAERERLLAAANERQQNGTLNPTLYEGNDLYNYLIFEEGWTMMHCQIKSDSSDVRLLFFLKDALPVSIHYRLFNSQPVRMTKEAFYYYDQGKLFYVEERSMLLKPEELPVAVKVLPFTRSQQPLGVLQAEVQPYWEKTLSMTKPYMEKSG